MSDYFDEQAVRQRVTRRVRRQFLYRLHTVTATIIALIFAAIVIVNKLIYPSLYNYPNQPVSTNYYYLRDLAIIAALWFFPLLLHRLWYDYRNHLDATLETEMHAAAQYRAEYRAESPPDGQKRKNTLPPAEAESWLPHLYDTGEFVPEEDDESSAPIRQKRR